MWTDQYLDIFKTPEVIFKLMTYHDFVARNCKHRHGECDQSRWSEQVKRLVSHVNLYLSHESWAIKRHCQTLKLELAVRYLHTRLRSFYFSTPNTRKHVLVHSLEREPTLLPYLYRFCQIYGGCDTTNRHPNLPFKVIGHMHMTSTGLAVHFLKVSANSFE